MVYIKVSMLIGLISDTHIAGTYQSFPKKELTQALKGVDLILHAGDIWIPWVLDELETIAPVLAAQGDDDLEEDVGDDKRVARRQNLSFEGLKIWVSHIKPRYSEINPNAHSSYSNIFNNRNMNQQTPPAEPVPPPDVIVYGHSHSAAIENYKGTIFINPGSPTVPEYIVKLGSIGFLNVKAGKVETRIVQLE
jgi:uncharacterized protein